MLSTILFIADPQMAGLLRQIASGSNEFAVEFIVQLDKMGYPLARVAGTARPDVLLLEVTEFERDLSQAAAIHDQFPDIPLVGLTSHDISVTLSRSSESVFASLVVWPFDVAQLEQAISSGVHNFHGEIHQNMVVFLPGKAGSGASTVALHTALVLANELKRRVLVIEGDLHSGLLSAMLQLEPKVPIREVLAEAPRLDTLSWQTYVTPARGVDFLLTNTAVKEPFPSWTHYFQLLRFAVPKYDLVLVDLPEVVNSATAEIVRRAHAIYVVCTPEFASLKLSKQRCEELGHWGVDRGRVQALLNRGQKNGIGPKDAERILDRPIAMTFPNDYKTVQRATTDASVIDKRSELGKAYVAFSRMLVGEEPEKSLIGLFRK